MISILKTPRDNEGHTDFWQFLVGRELLCLLIAAQLLRTEDS